MVVDEAARPGQVDAEDAEAFGQLYDHYATVPRIWGLTPIEDQNVGGAMMMVEQSIVLVIVLVFLFGRMLVQSEEEERRRERLEDAAAA